MESFLSKHRLNWHWLAVGAIILVATSYFLVEHFSAEGRFRSFTDNFFKTFSDKLDPTLKNIMRANKKVTAYDQSHSKYWHRSKDPSGKDNSWGTYSHLILFLIRDNPDYFLKVEVNIEFGQIPDGYSLPSGQSKGWARFGNVKVEATSKYVEEGGTNRPRTPIPHRALYPDALSDLADQITAAMDK